MSTLIFRADVGVLNIVFKEYNIAKTLDGLVSKVLKELLKFPEEALLQEEISNNLQIFKSTLSYIDLFGQLLDYLCFDSYKFDTIVE